MGSVDDIQSVSCRMKMVRRYGSIGGVGVQQAA